MPKEIVLVLPPRDASEKERYVLAAARALGVRKERIAFVRVKRRSIDARGKSVKINMGVEVYVDDERPEEEVHFEWNDVSGKTPVVVVGSGPAGLFAALRLIELGYKPLLLERGKDVSARKRDIAALNRNMPVDPDSNYCFGEGGAGTYSDGKLFTRSKKRGDYRKALEILHYHGADESILYDAHPHIGTDKLPRVIAAIRRTIQACGGEFCLESKVADLILRGDRICGVADAKGNRIEGVATILATGHSARDIYELLDRKGVLLEAKSFAMGVRVEHPQTLIDTIQYHMPERGEYLPAASYSLVAQVGGRGAYSFCMCPGGFIVPSATAEGQSVVNGMSPSGRNSRFANSGIVTEVRLSDFGFLQERYGALAGLRFQEQFERKAYENGGGAQIVPAQRLADFVAGKRSASLCVTSYHPGGVSSVMKEWMPPFIYEALKGGFEQFGKKMKGFMTNEAMVLGVESRTSSPVRIPRDSVTLMHPVVKGLFPCGEGAGYAGGIISAAIDGERAADAVAAAVEGGAL